jgi:hypothetical protein
MTRRREIYHQYNDNLKDLFDPREHVIYPFKEVASFHTIKSRFVKGWGRGFLYYDPLSCDYCGQQESTNSGGYYSGWIVFNSWEDVRFNCGCEGCIDDISHMPDFYDQQFGFHQPVKFPDKFKNSIDHVLAWKFGNKYKLNRYLGKEFTLNDLKKYLGPYGFGDGGFSGRGIFYGWVDYRGWKIKMKYMDMRQREMTWTGTDIARAYNDILSHCTTAVKTAPQQLELFE